MFVGLQEMRFDPSGGDAVAFALKERQAGRQAALATLVEIDGASPRALGAQMSVAEDGRFAGSISSGCLERAIVEEARAAMMRGCGGVVRYGKGSAFLDIALPCGSGVDILYTIHLSEEVLREALHRQAARQPFSLLLGPQGASLDETLSTGRRKEAFIRRYTPRLRIVAAGLGVELEMLSHLAAAAGYDFCAVSPDAETLARCSCEEKIALTSASATPAMAIDEWTAVVFLFHDREWEMALVPAALASPAYYIGAVGGRRTQALRLEGLRDLGVEQKALERLEGPIGLIPATRDPSALAISVMAGVVAAWPH